MDIADQKSKVDGPDAYRMTALGRQPPVVKHLISDRHGLASFLAIPPRQNQVRKPCRVVQVRGNPAKEVFRQFRNRRKTASGNFRRSGLHPY